MAYVTVFGVDHDAVQDMKGDLVRNFVRAGVPRNEAHMIVDVAAHAMVESCKTLDRTCRTVPDSDDYLIALTTALDWLLPQLTELRKQVLVIARQRAEAEGE